MSFCSLFLGESKGHFPFSTSFLSPFLGVLISGQGGQGYNSGINLNWSIRFQQLSSFSRGSEGTSRVKFDSVGNNFSGSLHLQNQLFLTQKKRKMGRRNVISYPSGVFVHAAALSANDIVRTGGRKRDKENSRPRKTKRSEVWNLFPFLFYFFFSSSAS